MKYNFSDSKLTHTFARYHHLSPILADEILWQITFWVSLFKNSEIKKQRQYPFMAVRNYLLIKYKKDFRSQCISRWYNRCKTDN